MKIVFSIHFLTSLVEAMQQVILAISGQKSWQRMLMNSLKRVEELDLNHPMISGGYILEIGGSLDFMDQYVKFRGSRPKMDGLLKASGISIK